MKFKITSEPLSIFSYSSLTDIVMLLLIFFLLSSQFVINTGVKVKLPGSKTNEQSEPSKLVVTLTNNGGVFVGGEQVSMDALSSKLIAMKSSSKEDNLIIRADKSIPLEMVIKVIDAARSSGVEKFTIETEKQQ